MKLDSPNEGPGTELETVLVAPRGERFHVPHGDRPLCAARGGFEEKSLSVYPPSHRNWCRSCLRLWEAASEEDRERVVRRTEERR